MGAFNECLHEVESEEDGIVVVGVGQDELVLELRAKPVVPLDGGLATRKLLAVPGVEPGDDEHAVVGRGAVGLELGQDRVMAKGRVVEEGILGTPAGVVVQGLEDDAVDEDVVGGDLVVEVAVVVLGEVDSDVEGHAGELGLKGSLQAVLLGELVTSVPEGDDTALGESGLVDLVEGTGLDLGGGVDQSLGTQEGESEDGANHSD